MSDFYTSETVDVRFYSKPKKSGKEPKLIDVPKLPYNLRLFDTHAHINMLKCPAVKIARAGFYGVKYIECMTDPLSEEGLEFIDEADKFFNEAQNVLLNFTGGSPCTSFSNDVTIPKYGISVGVHPHYAKNYTFETENILKEKLALPKVNSLGEIGLDYHYDFSPRDVQREVFERQLDIAKSLNKRVILHIRNGFDDAYSILKNFDFLSEVPILLHCYTSDKSEIMRWVDRGVFVAFGGAVTFASSEDIRESVRFVPKDRLLLETDAPFMAPVPFRGVECESAHMLFTLLGMFDVLGLSDDDVKGFIEQVFNNSRLFFGVDCG